MDKYRAQLSLHKKYRQATINKTNPSNNEVSSSATISTASASFDGSGSSNVSQHESQKHGQREIDDNNNVSRKSRGVSLKNETGTSSNSNHGNFGYRALGQTTMNAVNENGRQSVDNAKTSANGNTGRLNYTSISGTNREQKHHPPNSSKSSSDRRSTNRRQSSTNNINSYNRDDGKVTKSYLALNHGKNDNQRDNLDRDFQSKQNNTSAITSRLKPTNNKLTPSTNPQKDFKSQKNTTRCATPTPTTGRQSDNQFDRHKLYGSPNRYIDSPKTNPSFKKQSSATTRNIDKALPKLPIHSHKNTSSQQGAATTKTTITPKPSYTSIIPQSAITATNNPITNHEVTNHQSQSHNTNYYMVPTEGQLRWAQFHCKKRAESVQENVTKLMSYPLHEQDVEGALSGDGDSSIHSNSSTSVDSSNKIPSTKSKNKRRKRKKMKLSRGRRALLRVSARKTEERRKWIQLNGFAMHPDNDFDECENTIQNNPSCDDQQCHNDTLELDEITEALHVNLGDDNTTVLAERRKGGTISNRSGRDMGIIGSTILSGKKKKKSNTATSIKNNNGKGSAKHLKGKRSMVANADEEEERMRRFEEAYLAMCNAEENLKVTNNEPSTIKSTKRWTRGSHVPVAVSIDGRNYDDLQRSPAFKDAPSSRLFAAQTYGNEVNGKQLTDRVASWMMHLPKSTLRDTLVKAGPNFLRGRVSKNQEDESGEDVSPQKMKLMELVDRLQGHQFTPKSQNPEIFIDTEVELKTSALESTSTSNQVEDNKKALSPFAIGVSVAKLRDKLFQTNSHDLGQCAEEEDYSGEEDFEDGYADDENLINDSIESKIHEMAAHVKSHNSVIDTDMQSDVSMEGFELRMGSLMLSPTIITKRLNQAINAIESCQWDQVSYLVNANPWLAEMPEVTSNQYLLHKIAFHGTGTLIGQDSAPTDLHEDMLNACPASIHKFDSEGNLPLHLAAAAGNIDMVMRLIQSFEGGTSVRNNQGHLPLHMAVIACSKNYQISDQENFPERLVKVILDLFPGALAVTDNDGNLPVHLVSCHLKGVIGAEVMHILLQKAEEVGDKLRFSTGIKAMQVIDETMSDFDIDFTSNEESSIFSSRNCMNWTPLMSAVKNRAGWQILDSILCRNETEFIMYDTDEQGKNILQLTLEDECCDPPSTLSILKFHPSLVTKPDLNGALPIETACLRGLQEEIVMAIALLDLPIDLDADVAFIDVNNRDGFGGSWWYLNCECDDEHIKLVREILEICNYKQKRALCFAKNKKGRSLLRRATPKCKEELRKALRFDGRYEFIGNGSTSAKGNPKIFEALDFGTEDNRIESGQAVMLQCYGDEMEFNTATSVLRRINIDDAMLGRMRFFEVNDLESSSKPQFCISIDQPELTLSDIIFNMDRSKYLDDHERLTRYINKLRKVFKMIGEGINHLHSQGVVHGHINTNTCGKFDDGWKLLDLIGSNTIGSYLSTNRTSQSSPPEAVISEGKNMTSFRLSDHIVANISLDIWAFGKLMYEVLVGKQLIEIDSHKMVETDDLFLGTLKNWNEDDLSNVVTEIETAGVGTLAADLISHCLCPFPEHRPKDMKDVLTHPYWNELKSFQNNARKSKRRH